MSHLTLCNFCILESIKDRAKKEEKKIILRGGVMGGIDVFSIHKDEILPFYKGPNPELPNGCEIYQKYHIAWMLEIPDRCYC